MKTKVEEKGAVWIPDLGDGQYKNPIIHADYSDPDVVRVGEDYFMVASSFNMSPCLPILHSKDLVNWEIINHVSKKLPYEKYNLPRHGEGVWAPSIRYHDGELWVFFSMPDEGIFMSKTKDPFGKWSPLHLVKEVKGWIDPCPFWDDDGQAYLVHAFAKSRAGFKSKLQLCKMTSDGTTLLDDGMFVFDGTIDHPTIEGPKMYKRNGYYYIFAPAGGVATGWQTILRSKSIVGPYEDKIVLHQGNTNINGPHQGGWVDTASGESWFIHFQDKGAYGRITHLQPMDWKDDWPVMGTGNNDINEPVLKWNKPEGKLNGSILAPQTNDNFAEDSLGLQWQWRANVDESWYTLENKQLRLNAVKKPKGIETLYDTPNILTQKFPAQSFTATTLVTFNPNSEEVVTGMMVGGFKYGGIKLKKAEKGLSVIQFTGKNNDDHTFEQEQEVCRVDTNILYLRVTVSENVECQFSYSMDNKTYHLAGRLIPITKGKWIGALLGIFCVNEGNKDNIDHADFSWITIN